MALMVVTGRYSLESLVGDMTSVRLKVKSVSDQLVTCQDTAFNTGVAAFLQARNARSLSLSLLVYTG